VYALYFNFSIALLSSPHVSFAGPGAIQTPSFTTNTSAIFLNWTSPTGQVFSYKVERSKPGDLWDSIHTKDTSTTLSNLTSGTSYTIKITAIAGDNITEGETHTINQVTTSKPQFFSLSIL